MCALAQAPGQVRRDARRSDPQALGDEEALGRGSLWAVSLWSLIGVLSVYVLVSAKNSQFLRP